MTVGDGWTFRSEHRLRGYLALEFGGQDVLRCWSHAVSNDAPHLVLPNAEINLVARYSGQYCQVEVFGMTSEARWFRPTVDETLLAVTLSPERALSIGLHPRDWTNRMDLAPSKLQDRLAPVAERLLGLHITEARRRWLDAVYPLTPDSNDGFSAYSQARIREHHGQISLARLATEMQVNERQLQRRFRATLGLSPKRYAQQIRLAETIAAADTQLAPSWADLAAAGGYCDQSHLIRDCTKLTGLTPARLHALRTLSEKSNTPPAS